MRSSSLICLVLCSCGVGVLDGEEADAPKQQKQAPASGVRSATRAGVGTSGEVACPASSCAALASGPHDVLSCQDGKTLVRCASGTPRCYACKAGYSCFFNNGGAWSDDFCGAPPSSPTQPGVPSGCGQLSRAQVESLLRKAGFPEWSIAEMVRIAWCESEFYPCAISKASANPGKDWGLLQVSADHWLYPGESPYVLHDPWVNVTRAKQVFDLQGYAGWVCHYL
jgi:hypothetical protein